MNKIRKGDEVIVRAGKDKGKRGTVLHVLNNGKALVDDINTVKKHVKGNPQTGDAGGIITKEAAIQLSNLGVYNPASGKAERVGIRNTDTKRTDGKVAKERFFKSDGSAVDVS